MDWHDRYCRTAVLEDGRLCEYYCDEADEIREGTVFLGVCERTDPGLDAAFIDIGLSKNGFLSHPGNIPHAGDCIIVESVTDHDNEQKGLLLRTDVQLVGRFVILSPERPGVYLSKRIHGKELIQELKSWATEKSEGMGLILRSCLETQYLSDAEKELNSLKERWREIRQAAKGSVQPKVLWSPGYHCLSLLRESEPGKISSVICNHAEGAGKLEAASFDVEVHFEAEKTHLLMDPYPVESPLKKAMRRIQWLPCGAFLTVDFCEAFTVIDVNSGKAVGRRSNDAQILSINLEAVQAVARLIRLLNIGGIILVDLIDMRSKEDQSRVIAFLKQAVMSDSCPVSCEGITSLGILQLTRRRRGKQLLSRLMVSCDGCMGTGRKPSSLEEARGLVRALRRKILSGEDTPVTFQCGNALAEIIPSQLEAQFPWPDIYVQITEGTPAILSGETKGKKIYDKVKEIHHA